jgi:hypothetical protein
MPAYMLQRPSWHELDTEPEYELSVMRSIYCTDVVCELVRNTDSVCFVVLDKYAHFMFPFWS